MLVLAAVAFGAAIVGTNAGETIPGTPDADVINAKAGDDTLNGDEGNDRLKDNKGANKFSGGPGDDRIDARDIGKERGTAAGIDTVDCGDGVDTLRVDSNDTQVNCEKVRVRADKGGKGKGKGHGKGHPTG